MTDHRLTDAKSQDLREFCAFIDSVPVTPSAVTESKVMQKVMKDLRPSKWLVYGKVFSIETFAGIATLFICPQFGLGFGDHNPFLHALHENLNPFLFYLICGLIFVVIGAALSALLLGYDEIRTINRSKYAYYLAYAFTAYFFFVVLGSEALLISTTPWILGSILGNAFGFGLVSRMRFIRPTAS